MGHGSYDFMSSVDRSVSYKGLTNSSIFKEKSINNAMDPHGARIRESRDSIEHPRSLAIVIALDLTGSMGSIPNHLVKEGLPNIMSSIIQKGINDPQVLFLGVGDHECDRSPLQVGQFESSGDLLDKWLTTVYLEGGGGGNAGESYLLAWYFAGYRTSIDCFEKRKEKGFLFTIGDEPTLRDIPQNSLKTIIGEGQYENFTAEKLYEKASETYNVFHIHVKETSSGSRQFVIDGWRQLLQDNLIVVDRHEEVSKVISDIVTKKAVIKTTQKVDKVSSTEEIML